ncbi:MAG: hypothetical protein AAFR61_28460 [Bacteroidota bacterium]
MNLVKIMYAANILVAGWISLSCLFWPEVAQRTVFESSIAYSEGIRLIGALWGGIFVLSILGMFFPESMRLVFLFQLIYKGSWLLLVALPALIQAEPYPKSMAIFFLVWVLALPWVIPWKALFQG